MVGSSLRPLSLDTERGAVRRDRKNDSVRDKEEDFAGE